MYNFDEEFVDTLPYSNIILYRLDKEATYKLRSKTILKAR